MDLVQITRITRMPYSFTLPAAIVNPESVVVAIIPKRHTPNGLTVWQPADAYDPATRLVTINFLTGPDADQTDALDAGEKGGDLWAADITAPLTNAAKAARITVDGGVYGTVGDSLASQVLAALAEKVDTDDARLTDARTPTGGAGGALSGTYPNPGLNETTVDSIVAGKVADGASGTGVALRAASVTAVQQAITDGVIDVGGDVPTGLVTSPVVGRIIAVKQGDAVPALQQGDLVVTYAAPGNVYYKDFSADAVDAAPAGLTKLTTTSGMSVKAVTGATGGKALQAGSGTTGVTAYAITASMADPYLQTVEILSRWRHATSHGFSAFFNSDFTADSYYRASYNVVSTTGRARITVRQNGANVTAPEATIALIPDNTWCMTRTRREAGTTYVKHWVETDPEPAAWQFSLANSAVPVGPPAVGTGGSVTFDVDWFVVATGGKAAVKP